MPERTPVTTLPPDDRPTSMTAALAAAVRAGFATPARRLRNGPLVPGWSLTYETRVAIMRAASRWVFTTDDVDGARRMVAWASSTAPVARGVEVQRAPLGGVPTEWATAENPEESAILLLHGGGYMVGSPASYRWFATHLAREARCRVATPAYRLAPEHAWPAALDDAVAAYRGLLSDGVPPERIALCGDSAGGGLALALLLRQRDEGGPLPACAALLSPWTDLTGGSPSLVENDGLDYLERWYLPTVARRYAAGVTLRNPYVSPVFADLRGLPPLLVQVGGAEVLRDDGVRLAESAQAAGVDVRLEVWPDEVHVWQQFAGWHRPADDARRGAVAFVRAATR